MPAGCLVSMTVVACLLLSAAAVADDSTAARTQLVKTDAGWELRRDGKPYVIKGVGGSGSKEMLKQLGGNSFRTWDAENIGAQLDEAQRLGLTVAVGIWLKHERHGFDYNDPEFVARQFETVRQQVLRYRDHPAVLMWVLGNEMEGEHGDNAAVWSHIEACAALVKRLDPSRPTMTVVAEIGGQKVRNLHALCPSIDILGVNSYAGASSLVQRYRAAGGTKPLVLTEFGPFGTWEVERNAFGSLPEPTANAKAEWYRRHYQGTVIDGKDMVLGSYAFTWGSKLEMTHTWFGMLLGDGSKLPAVDAVSELWTGRPPANRSPSIQPIQLSGPPRIAPGGQIEASVSAVDPEGDKLSFEWHLTGEVARPGLGGDPEHAPPEFKDAVKVLADGKAAVTLPATPGRYRLYVYVRDGKGSATTANVPLLVEAGNQVQEATPPPVGAATGEVRKAKLPLEIYTDDGVATPYAPSGWMGNQVAIKFDPKHADRPHSGKTCISAEYTAVDGFGGIVWQDPANDWGEAPGGYDLSGATHLTFWARGNAGGEKVEFKFGVLGPEKPHPDSSGGGIVVELTDQWQRYEIDLAGKDLSRIKSGFCWVAAGQGGPVRFYLDDIVFERR